MFVEKFTIHSCKWYQCDKPLGKRHWWTKEKKGKFCSKDEWMDRSLLYFSKCCLQLVQQFFLTSNQRISATVSLWCKDKNHIIQFFFFFLFFISVSRDFSASFVSQKLFTKMFLFAITLILLFLLFSVEINSFMYIQWNKILLEFIISMHIIYVYWFDNKRAFYVYCFKVQKKKVKINCKCFNFFIFMLASYLES